MAKKIPKVVADNPSVVHIELGVGCGKFCTIFYPTSFLTDIRDPHRDCDASIDPFYFRADANEISEYVPNNKFELVICCNPYQYGFKTELEAFTLLKQFSSILVPNNGKIRVIGTKSKNPYINIKKIERFIAEYNTLNSTKFEIIEEKELTGLYPNFIFRDMYGNQVTPNTEIIIAN